nr:hypothetical protein [Tanacetum cinerariifolium]
MIEFYQLDSGLVVPVFTQGDDPIACLNKAMAFLLAVAASRFPSTNNQLITFSNMINQATIQDGKVIVQKVQGKQGQSYAGGRDEGESWVSGGVGWKLGKVVLWKWREKWLVHEQYLLSKREGRSAV